MPMLLEQAESHSSHIVGVSERPSQLNSSLAVVKSALGPSNLSQSVKVVMRMIHF